MGTDVKVVMESYQGFVREELGIGDMGRAGGKPFWSEAWSEGGLGEMEELIVASERVRA